MRIPGNRPRPPRYLDCGMQTAEIGSNEVATIVRAHAKFAVALDQEERGDMKIRILTLTIPVTLFAVLAAPIQLAAQHIRYKLIDIGTFGGPASYFTDPGIGGKSKVLNNQGMLAGKAETTTPIPSFGNVGNCPPACFVTHVFRWDKGVLTDLGALPGGDNSDIGGVNARGWLFGSYTTAATD